MSDSLYDIFGLAENQAEDGKWFSFGKEIEVKIRRFKSKKSRKVRENLEAPYKRANRYGKTTLSDAVTEEITNNHIAEGIVADWKGVKSKDGQDLPYSPAAALQLFKDLPEFRDAVVEISLNIEEFRDEEKEEVRGN